MMDGKPLFDTEVCFYVLKTYFIRIALYDIQERFSMR